MRGLPSILSLFHNKFSKFNKTRARMLDSIHHMIKRLLRNLISALKNVILSLRTQHCYGHNNTHIFLFGLVKILNLMFWFNSISHAKKK